MVKKQHNYNATISIYIRVRATTLRSIIGDYNEQFGQLRDYAYELYMQNPRSTFKIESHKDLEGQYVFEILYVCIDV